MARDSLFIVDSPFEFCYLIRNIIQCVLRFLISVSQFDILTPISVFWLFFLCKHTIHHEDNKLNKPRSVAVELSSSREEEGHWKCTVVVVDLNSISKGEREAKVSSADHFLISGYLGTYHCTWTEKLDLEIHTVPHTVHRRNEQQWRAMDLLRK